MNTEISAIDKIVHDCAKAGYLMKTFAITFNLILTFFAFGCSNSDSPSPTGPMANTNGNSTNTVTEARQTPISKERATRIAIAEARKHGWTNSEVFGAHREAGKWSLILFKIPQELGENAIVEVSIDGNVITFQKGH